MIICLRRFCKCMPLKCFYITVIIAVACLAFYFLFTRTLPLENDIIKADICLVPTIETDHQVLKYFNYTLPFSECRNGVPPLVRQKDKNRISRIIFKYLDTTQLDCSYSPLKLNKFKKLQVTDKWKSFGNDARIKDEYIKVNCSFKKNVIYEDFFAFPPRNVKKRKKNNPKRFNVLLIGIRALSRINAYRKLSKFTNYLRYNLQAAEFGKYNVIDGTSAKNIVPLLSGMYHKHFLRNCTKHNERGCNLIWQKFAKEGYKTLLAEDCAENGIFRQGVTFPKLSVDYSFMPFMHMYESNTGNIWNGECYLCTSSKKAYKILLDYYLNFAKLMRDNRQEHFAMLWINSLTHTENSYNGLNAIEVAADDLTTYLRTLDTRGYLENTFVIIFSDTGYMSPDLQNKRQFMLEKKQPLLFITPPKLMRKFKSSVVHKLNENTKKLVNAFDVHATLETISKVDAASFRPFNGNGNKTVGLSLFQTIPNRLCEEAGIVRKFCGCKYIPVYRSWKVVKKKPFGIL